ncbi:neuronal acetylcholine receptor subunit beta-4-like [Saccoglossus kowalevskii]|uniref:Acetylcholine receptor subunit alpha-like 1-like n=1 Tax=Saccoglossus kowalevskii TaxID=10224 RepID=A0ABM0M653_SACKO|nr:PREDICTED: acetylcholine receptor subunit alpha-like 1-like [Saccoglossus kowalevskii]
MDKSAMTPRVVLPVHHDNGVVTGYSALTSMRKRNRVLRCCIAHLDQRKPADDKLLSDLFAENRYNKLARPAINYNSTVNFALGLHMTQVMNMDEKNQIMKTRVRLEQLWDDYRLAWNPKDYGGIRELVLPLDKIWYPKLSLINSADGEYELKGEQNVLVISSGMVFWNAPCVLTTSCRINVRYFPFDEQKCLIAFTIRDYEARRVFLSRMYTIVKKTENSWEDYWQDGEWDLIASPVEEFTEQAVDTFYVYLFHTLILRRKPLFYIINLIAPSVLLSGLTILTFALPPDSGEKVTLSISIFLAMMIFKLMVAEIVPPTSANVALIDQYLLFNATMVVMGTGFTVLVLSIHHRLSVTHDMPLWVRSIFIEFLPRFICINKPRHKGFKRRSSAQSSFSKLFSRARRTAMKEKYPNEVGGGGNHSPNHIASLRKEMTNMAESTKFISEHLKKEDADNKLTDEWRYVAVVLDRMLLWLYVIIYTFATCAIILNAPLARGSTSSTIYTHENDADTTPYGDYPTSYT